MNGKSKLRLGAVLTVLSGICVAPLRADLITIRGTINQSVQDGTGPAVNNLDLNRILDGDLFQIDLSFAGSITAPGTYQLTGLGLVLNDVTAGVAESSFSSASLTIARSGASDVFSLLACLSTGSGCNQGNELDLNFAIPFASLNAANVAAQGVPGLIGLDLLEDDGVTDIHGTLASYSYTPPGGTTPVPEPSTVLLVGSVAAGVALKLAVRQRGTKPR